MKSKYSKYTEFGYPRPTSKLADAFDSGATACFKGVPIEDNLYTGHPKHNGTSEYKCWLMRFYFWRYGWLNEQARLKKFPIIVDVEDR